MLTTFKKKIRVFPEMNVCVNGMIHFLVSFSPSFF
jgi:hypothetical protein